MGKKHTSIIWTISKEELVYLNETSSSVTDLLSKLGLLPKGNNNLTLKNRMIAGGLDYESLAKKHRINTTPIPRERISLDKVLVSNSSYNRSHLKKRLLKERLLEKKGALCSQGTHWNNRPLVLVLDHINGVSNDNRLKNLRLLCPNCNSQTKTFAGRNIRRSAQDTYTGVVQLEERRSLTAKVSGSNPLSGKKTVHVLKCPFCKKQYVKKKDTQRYCSTICCGKARRKIEWPEKEYLEVLIKENSWCSIGMMFNVSDNAVRKWARIYGLLK